VVTARGASALLVTLAMMAVIGCSASTSKTAASHEAGPPVADTSCSAEPTSHSLNSDHPTSFTIINHTSVTLTALWLDFTGKRVKYFDLPPGQSHHQNTFVTHPWVIADPQGMCIRLFTVATATATTITIG
jgi:hypothetical protein